MQQKSQGLAYALIPQSDLQQPQLPHTDMADYAHESPTNNPLYDNSLADIDHDIKLQRKNVGLSSPEQTEANLITGKDDGPPMYVRLLAAIASLNSCNIGYDIGINTGVAQSFQRDGHDGIRLPDYELELYMGVLSFTALIGALSMSTISDNYGRRITFIVSQIVLLIGIGIMLVSTEYGLLMFGRSISGIAIGLGFAVDPMYIAEIAPAKYRGQLVSWSETATNIGILLGFIAGFVFRGIKGNTQWRIMIGLGMVLPVVLIALVFTVLPESPRWLLQKQRPEEAATILKRCAPKEETRNGEELARDLKADIDEELAASASVSWTSMFQSKVHRSKLLAGVGTATAQQLTGIDAVQYYLLSVFQDAGITSTADQFGALVLVGIVKVVAIIIAGYLFDWFGRKSLLISSNLGLAAALILLAGASNTLPALSFSAVVIYVFAFSIGMGPGAWLIPSEVFSNDIRAKGISLSTFGNRFMSLIFLTSFLSMRNALTPAGAFIFFAVICIANAAFIRRFVPETKGRTLEEVHLLFEG